MDPSAWIGGSAGLGGLVVSIYGISKSRRTDRDNLGVRQIEIALEAQQEQLDRQNTHIIHQDSKIAEQAVKLEQQAGEIRELREEVHKCKQEKMSLTMELELLRRTI